MNVVILKNRVKIEKDKRGDGGFEDSDKARKTVEHSGSKRVLIQKREPLVKKNKNKIN